MATALAVPLVQAAIANAPNILAAASMATEMAMKYGPKVRGAVNHLFSLGRKRKSAASRLKKLGTRKGLKRFITKDIGRGLNQAGRAISTVQEFAGDVGGVAGEGMRGGAMSDHASRIASAIGRGANSATRYHQIAEKYHSKGENLVSPLKAYRM